MQAVCRHFAQRVCVQYDNSFDKNFPDSFLMNFHGRVTAAHLRVLPSKDMIDGGSGMVCHCCGIHFQM